MGAREGSRGQEEGGDCQALCRPFYELAEGLSASFYRWTRMFSMSFFRWRSLALTLPTCSLSGIGLVAAILFGLRLASLLPSQLVREFRFLLNTARSLTNIFVQDSRTLRSSLLEPTTWTSTFAPPPLARTFPFSWA